MLRHSHLQGERVCSFFTSIFQKYEKLFSRYCVTRTHGMEFLLVVSWNNKFCENGNYTSGTTPYEDQPVMLRVPLNNQKTNWSQYLPSNNFSPLKFIITGNTYKDSRRYYIYIGLYFIINRFIIIGNFFWLFYQKWIPEWLVILSH